MKDRVLIWVKQAKREMESAERALAAGDFYLVAWLCHQSVEKMLRALLMHKNLEPPEEKHSLIRLGHIASVPPEHDTRLRELTPHYTLSRYPDASGEPPYELYTKEKAEALMEDAKEVIVWIEEQMAP
ncbi:MAG: HEPN domain-containing protein [Thermoplasmata archaeon]